MKKNLTTAFVALLILFCGVSHAQEMPTVLNSADIDRFVTTLKPLTEELDALGYEEDADFQNMATNATALTILQKYGWDYGSFLTKWTAISMGYAKLKLDAQVEAMPADQREMMRQSMSFVTCTL